MMLQYHLIQKATTHSPMHPLIIACQQYIALHPTFDWRSFYFETLTATDKSTLVSVSRKGTRYINHSLT